MMMESYDRKLANEYIDIIVKLSRSNEMRANESDAELRWIILSLYIRWIENIISINEILLDTPGRDESIEKTDASSFVVGSTAATTAERLSADNGTRAFVIHVEIPCYQRR